MPSNFPSLTFNTFNLLRLLAVRQAQIASFSRSPRAPFSKQRFLGVCCGFGWQILLACPGGSTRKEQGSRIPVARRSARPEPKRIWTGGEAGNQPRHSNIIRTTIATTTTIVSPPQGSVSGLTFVLTRERMHTRMWNTSKKGMGLGRAMKLCTAENNSLVWNIWPFWKVNYLINQITRNVQNKHTFSMAGQHLRC